MNFLIKNHQNIHNNVNYIIYNRSIIANYHGNSIKKFIFSSKDHEISEKPPPKLKLTQLGKTVEARKNPDEAEIEAVPNPHPDVKFLARFTCPEFTSLCPITHQPDFAHVVIDYVPKHRMVESKSLKLFLQSFRNHGSFHEDCTVYIAKRLIHTLDPHWLRICGFFYPRGGIPIDVFYQTGKPPEDVHIPDPGVSPYKGRG